MVFLIFPFENEKGLIRSDLHASCCNNVSVDLFNSLDRVVFFNSEGKSPAALGKHLAYLIGLIDGGLGLLVAREFEIVASAIGNKTVFIT